MNGDTEKIEAYVQQSTAVILVGGQSRRMDYQDKMNLKIGNDSFLEHLLKELSFFSHIVISANAKQVKLLDKEKLNNITKSEICIMEDKIPEIGPLGGIYTAMTEIQTPYLFVVSCDTPFVKKNEVEMLYQHLSEEDSAVVLMEEERIHPLFAIYHQKVLPILKHQIEKNNYRMRWFCEEIHSKYVENITGNKVMNINTHDEYNFLRKKLEKTN